MTHRFAPFAIALTLVLAACGTTGDDESGDTTTTTEAEESSTTSETTASTTTEPEVDEEAQARAEAVDITLDDFPEGWEASPHQDGRGRGPHHPVQRVRPRGALARGRTTPTTSRSVT